MFLVFRMYQSKRSDNRSKFMEMKTWQFYFLVKPCFLDKACKLTKTVIRLLCKPMIMLSFTIPQSGKATGCTMADGEECWRLGFQDAEAGRLFHPSYDGWNLFCQQRYEEGRLAKVVANSKATIVSLLKDPSHGH